LIRHGIRLLGKGCGNDFRRSEPGQCLTFGSFAGQAALKSTSNRINQMLARLDYEALIDDAALPQLVIEAAQISVEPLRAHAWPSTTA
jgi:hypothetical protein